MTQPPAPVVPVCYRHTDRETYVRCNRCDRPICPDCMNEASVGFQCPECVREGSKTQRQARTAFGGTQAGAAGTVTITLIVINVLVFIIGIISAGSNAAKGVAGGGLGGLLSGSTPLHDWGAEVPYFTAQGSGIRLAGDSVADGDFYQLFTSIFLHYGVFHLLMNMWALWILGRPLEAALGRVRFLALYLLCGLGGSVLVFLAAAPNTASAGASGAIFGMFTALIVVFRRMRLSVASIIPVLVLNLILTFSISGISWQAHIGGLVTGALVAAGFAYAPQKQRTPVQIATVAGTLVLFAILLGVGLANVPPVGSVA
ncbi:rhomboid family intramembrane serine protease [Dactylosporangium matsuzakiense]|uniref:Rhomboid family intramembrane serine protease n=1 Tax=Dactylosporangium matsuzakiense TaxID=53360 RepID=A0A9W6KK72_9ACTN|nr:rhomboid family intramembrane serine protease [Dactylosporangium matsuzakiense]UWZ44917.1 rhomboid family intramembrane serine protease [Dactylosporangium matsuzakiense]GLL03602.1 rhomboid family intramembrane serine protease [Dactylosporangium matsuzakiense]